MLKGLIHFYVLCLHELNKFMKIDWNCITYLVRRTTIFSAKQSCSSFLVDFRCSIIKCAKPIHLQFKFWKIIKIFILFRCNIFKLITNIFQIYLKTYVIWLFNTSHYMAQLFNQTIYSIINSLNAICSTKILVQELGRFDTTNGVQRKWVF